MARRVKFAKLFEVGTVPRPVLKPEDRDIGGPILCDSEGLRFKDAQGFEHLVPLSACVDIVFEPDKAKN